MRIDLANGTMTNVATGLSCPEGVALSGGALFTVENPVGDECLGHDLKPVAQLTRIDLASGAQTKVAGLLGPHGLDASGGDAYVCEWGAHQLTRVDLKSGTKTRVAPLASPSGCAVGGGYAYAVEQGDTDGSLVSISLSSGAKATRDGGVSADSAVGLFQTVFGSADFDPLVGKFPLLEQALH